MSLNSEIRTSEQSVTQHTAAWLVHSWFVHVGNLVTIGVYRNNLD